MKTKLKSIEESNSVTAMIDELNQYEIGNVTKAGLIHSLKGYVNELTGKIPTTPCVDYDADYEDEEEDQKMIIDDEFTKFEEMTVVSSNQVWWAATDEIELLWNDKKFTIRMAENSKGGELIWMKGEDQFTKEEIDEIEEYLWSGELDLSAI